MTVDWVGAHGAILLARLHDRFSRKNLRSLADKANHVAGVIYVWRPFLGDLWRALEHDPSSRALAGSVWTKPVFGKFCGG